MHVPGAKEIDGEDKQTDTIIYFPVTPDAYLFLSCRLVLAAASSGGEKHAAALTEDFHVMERQTDIDTDRGADRTRLI